MAAALYGDGGFYRSSGAPARHFRTAAHATPAWAQAMTELAQRVDTALDRAADFTLVDVGAGGGELLDGIAALAPPRWSLIGVDVASRPAGLHPRVDWRATPPAEVTGLVLAVELLDVLPVDVVELTANGPRLVEVSETGAERLGPAPSSADLTWLLRWWPLATPGDRAEIGTGRDELWGDVTARLRRGLAVAVDYAADPARDVAGTLTGYRDGRQVLPVPDGTCDLTAHVLVESLLQPGGVVTAQRAALRSLGLDGRRPAYSGDPKDYLEKLSAAGEAAELLARAGLGDFRWVLQPVGIDLEQLSLG